MAKDGGRAAIVDSESPPLSLLEAAPYDALINTLLYLDTGSLAQLAATSHTLLDVILGHHGGTLLQWQGALPLPSDPNFSALHASLRGAPVAHGLPVLERPLLTLLQRLAGVPALETVPHIDAAFVSSRSRLPSPLGAVALGLWATRASALAARNARLCLESTREAEHVVVDGCAATGHGAAASPRAAPPSPLGRGPLIPSSAGLPQHITPGDAAWMITAVAKNVIKMCEAGGAEAAGSEIHNTATPASEGLEVASQLWLLGGLALACAHCAEMPRQELYQLQDCGNSQDEPAFALANQLLAAWQGARRGDGAALHAVLELSAAEGVRSSNIVRIGSFFSDYPCTPLQKLDAAALVLRGRYVQARLAAASREAAFRKVLQRDARAAAVAASEEALCNKDHDAMQDKASTASSSEMGSGPAALGGETRVEAPQAVVAAGAAPAAASVGAGGVQETVLQSPLVLLRFSVAAALQAADAQALTGALDGGMVGVWGSVPAAWPASPLAPPTGVLTPAAMASSANTAAWKTRARSYGHFPFSLAPLAADAPPATPSSSAPQPQVAVSLQLTQSPAAFTPLNNTSRSPARLSGGRADKPRSLWTRVTGWLGRGSTHKGKGSGEGGGPGQSAASVATASSVSASISSQPPSSAHPPPAHIFSAPPLWAPPRFASLIGSTSLRVTSVALAEDMALCVTQGGIAVAFQIPALLPSAPSHHPPSTVLNAHPGEAVHSLSLFTRLHPATGQTHTFAFLCCSGVSSPASSSSSSSSLRCYTLPLDAIRGGHGAAAAARRQVLHQHGDAFNHPAFVEANASNNCVLTLSSVEENATVAWRYRLWNLAVTEASNSLVLEATPTLTLSNEGVVDIKLSQGFLMVAVAGAQVVKEALAEPVSAPAGWSPPSSSSQSQAQQQPQPRPPSHHLAAQAGTLLQQVVAEQQTVVAHHLRRASTRLSARLSLSSLPSLPSPQAPMSPLSATDVPPDAPRSPVASSTSSNSTSSSISSMTSLPRQRPTPLLHTLQGAASEGQLMAVHLYQACPPHALAHTLVLPLAPGDPIQLLELLGPRLLLKQERGPYRLLDLATGVVVTTVAEGDYTLPYAQVLLNDAAVRIACVSATALELRDQNCQLLWSLSGAAHPLPGGALATLRAAGQTGATTQTGLARGRFALLSQNAVTFVDPTSTISPALLRMPLPSSAPGGGGGGFTATAFRYDEGTKVMAVGGDQNEAGYDPGTLLLLHCPSLP